MDKVNLMLADRHIPEEMAVRVRLYFHNARVLARLREYRELENMMSLKLRGEVASAAQRGWVSRVWYLADAHADLLRDISQLLAALVFAPKELMDLPEALFTVRRGGERPPQVALFQPPAPPPPPPLTATTPSFQVRSTRRAPPSR